MGLIPGLGRSPGEGNGNPLQDTCLRNSMDRGTWWATIHEVTVRHDWAINSFTFKSLYWDAFLVGVIYCGEWFSDGCQFSRDMGSIPGLGRSPGEGNGNPLQYYCLENPMDRGAWWAIVHGVTKIQTPLRWLSSSSSKFQITLVKRWSVYVHERGQSFKKFHV